ncbi:hypothetical protein G6O67_000190 [Ophiocordyceps sinensis]|uniref:Uncharacterized protein n=1 Tax=Ophiocordyceps sinensis TaxID=72228 RepID=A0A8H4V9Q3_9HYPO|nr:hypothetical protein G6O67_000190 [Ophiocordyceps sinensis]
MGPPRTRAQDLAAAAARGRFLEGSMNDRASAAPPVAFLGPAERAALEGPAPDDARPRPERRPTRRGRRAAGRTRLGLVWEGVRGRLRMRREAADGDAGEKKPSSSSAPPPPPPPQLHRPADGVDRPSREEVLASYHQLVSAGFFADRAVHSTRRPARPATAHARDQRRCSPPPPPPHRRAPQWPLAAPASPVCSPASLASSRGTKRPAAAADDDDDDDAREPPAPHAADDDTLARRLLPKRLRRSASRDMSLPRVRRAMSAAAALPGPPRRLARLALPVNAAGSRASMRASPSPSPAAADADAAAPASPRRPSGPRNLRPRIVGGPLSVAPDANRGVPGVPVIPAKFSGAEDQENGDGARTEPRP